MAHIMKKPDMIISPRPLVEKKNPAGAVRKTRTDTFEKILQNEVRKETGVKFSAHAARRLESRNINLTESQQRKLEEAITRAESKGVKDSLVLLNRLAFIVNVRNRTVVTAMDENQIRDGIFTNIDGAMIIPGDE